MDDTITRLKNIYHLADAALDMEDQGLIDALYEIKDKAASLIEDWYEFTDEGND